jgi:CCR4-NOT transcription complex subunit 2
MDTADSSSSTPLYATFATPFAPPSNLAAKPTVPDFTLPAAYRVQNVPPLHTKISSMSDEALMAIFYSMTRDLAQELAAQELWVSSVAP